MNNQLDLQESELSTYEDMINTIADKLEQTELELEEKKQQYNELYEV